MKLELDVNEINFVLQTLGQLPSSSGVWPLIVKIKEQAEDLQNTFYALSQQLHAGQSQGAPVYDEPHGQDNTDQAPEGTVLDGEFREL